MSEPYPYEGATGNNIPVLYPFRTTTKLHVMAVTDVFNNNGITIKISILSLVTGISTNWKLKLD